MRVTCWRCGTKSLRVDMARMMRCVLNPLMRMTLIPALPGGVDSAYMVSSGLRIAVKPSSER